MRQGGIEGLDRALRREVHRAAEAVARGVIVACPTETYYGLAVPALDGSAVERLLLAKGREAERTLPIVLGSEDMLDRLVACVPPLARQLMARHWPGPLTIVLPARPEVPEAVCGPHGVGVRVSSHPVARALAAACGGAITATSANVAGYPPARTPAEVRRSLGDRVHVLQGGETAGGPPSTVAAIVDGRVLVLRPGAVRL